MIERLCAAGRIELCADMWKGLDATDRAVLAPGYEAMQATLERECAAGHPIRHAARVVVLSIMPVNSDKPRLKSMRDSKALSRPPRRLKGL